MAPSSASEFIFISVNHSITFMGKMWLIVMIFLRVLVFLLAGHPLYQDEQERFVCNTIQPGCANVCYDLFAPISLVRFWLVQLISLCLPYIVFIIYVVHKVCNILAVDVNSSSPVKARMWCRVFQESIGKELDHFKLGVVAELGQARCFTGAYVLHLLFRMFLEAGFGAAHYYLFGFYIPRRFLCQQPPCTTQVDCYISRPTEKTVLLIFMLGVAGLSLLLNILDVICAIKRLVGEKNKRKLMEKVLEKERYYLSSGEDCKGLEVGNGAGSFRKRRESKGSSGDRGSCQDFTSTSRPPASPPSGSLRSNTNGNNGYSVSQEEVPERAGSEVALCPVEPSGTPRSIRVNKRNRLKPPPPPRRDLCLTPGKPVGPTSEIPAATTVSTRRMGQYTLVSEEKEEKRSEWV